MKEEDLKKITDSISSKIGEENTALIADDFGLLFTNNKNSLENISNLNSEITKLKDINEKLVSANGSLLQQIPMGISQPKKESKEENHQSFNFRDAFDEKGNFLN